MKRVVAILLMLCFTTISFGQVSNKSDSTQLKHLIIESFNEIWSRLDAGNLDKYYTKDFLLLENGEVWNNDSIKAYLQIAVLRKPNPVRKNTIDIIKISIVNNVAWIAYQNSAIFLIDDKVVRKALWLESATATLTSDGWKLTSLHSTVIKNESTF